MIWHTIFHHIKSTVGLICILEYLKYFFKKIINNKSFSSFQNQKLNLVMKREFVIKTKNNNIDKKKIKSLNAQCP